VKALDAAFLERREIGQDLDPLAGGNSVGLNLAASIWLAVLVVWSHIRSSWPANQIVHPEASSAHFESHCPARHWVLSLSRTF
jgi:hypothetical protein